MKKKLRKVINKRKIQAKSNLPRIVIYRSNLRIYAQIIDNISGKVLAAASDLSEKDRKSKKDSAYIVGKGLAAKAIKNGIKNVVFDRREYKYHGRVSELAKGARDGGLKF